MFVRVCLRPIFRLLFFPSFFSFFFLFPLFLFPPLLLFSSSSVPPDIGNRGLSPKKHRVSAGSRSLTTNGDYVCSHTMAPVRGVVDEIGFAERVSALSSVQDAGPLLRSKVMVVEPPAPNPGQNRCHGTESAGIGPCRPCPLSMMPIASIEPHCSLLQGGRPNWARRSLEFRYEICLALSSTRAKQFATEAACSVSSSKQFMRSSIV
ncbi:hypothetical protein J3F83DRAFT_748736 [Trichoderma novae-zelandiae]